MRLQCPDCQHIFEPSKHEVQSKVGKSNRARGASFERTVAKKLETWWGNGSQFRRTPQSGGSALKNGFDMAGDLACNDPSFKYHIECKNVRTFVGVHQVLVSTNPLMYQWFEQSCRDCAPDKVPWVIFAHAGQQFVASKDVVPPQAANLKLMTLPGDKGSTIYLWSLSDMVKTAPELWK